MKLDEEPVEMIRLIKICCSLSHGNAAVERGFSITKRLVADRGSLTEESVKGQKTVKESLKNHGGAHNVPLEPALINSVKCAAMNRKKKEQEEKKRKEDEKREAEEADEAAQRREDEADKKLKWEEKKEKIEKDIKLAKATQKSQDNILESSMDRAMELQSELGRKTAMKTAETAKEAINNLREELEYLNKKLVKHLGKKP